MDIVSHRFHDVRFRYSGRMGFEISGGKYDIKAHDVLILKDKKRRRGSWVLETTEITEQYKDARRDMKAELENLANDIREKVKFNCSGDYETSETPGISVTNVLLLRQ